ncbi:uncharacterized protein V6R79_022696 [Siganus canaliculatus]
MEFSLRAATVEDCKDMARMIMEMAVFDNLADRVKLTQKDLEQDGFSGNPFYRGIIAEVPEKNKTKDGHTKIGYALYYYTYNSRVGKSVYMEDLYVMPEFRGKGIGKALMCKVAQMGLDVGCNLLDFIVSNKNQSAVNFYVSQGCVDVTVELGYHSMRCYGEALQRLGRP